MSEQAGYPLLGRLFELPGVDAPPGPPGQRIRLLRPPQLGAAEWIVAERSSHLWRIHHDEYDLCIVPAAGNAADAGASYTYRRWTIECRPGAIYLLEPDTLHVNRRLFAPASFYVLRAPRAVVSALGCELGLGAEPHFRAASSGSPILECAVDALARAVAEEAPALTQETLLCRALRVALQDAGEGRGRGLADAPPPVIARVRDYLHANLTADIHLDDLERLTGLTRYHLIRSFARVYGVAPHAYQNTLRTAEARRLLLAGVHPADIDVGFFDQGHLIRHFKRAYAVTPAAYQRASARTS